MKSFTTPAKDPECVILLRSMLVALLCIVIVILISSSLFSDLKSDSAQEMQQDVNMQIQNSEGAGRRVLVNVIEEPIAVKPKQTPLPDPAANKQVKVAEQPASASAQPEGTLADGSTPAIEASFGFPVLDYIRHVQQRAQARLVVLDRSTGQPVGEVRRDRFYPTNTIGKDMSLRARDITRDLPADYRANLLRQVSAADTHGPWRFLLIFPRVRQKGFEQALASTLQAKGLDWANVEKLQIRYLRDNKGLLAQIELAYISGAPVTVGTKTRLW